MKTLKKILGYVSVALIVVGVVMFIIFYNSNKQVLSILFSSEIVKGSMGIIKKLGISALLVVLGLIVLNVYFKVSASIYKDEKEKKKALKEQQKQEKKAANEQKKAERKQKS